MMPETFLRDTTDPFETQLSARFMSASKRLSIVVGLIGVAVLIGWTFDIEILKCGIPGYIPMRVNTAFAFLLTGCSLLMQQKSSGSNQITQWTGKFLAIIIFCIGFFTFIESIFNLDFYMDQFIFQQQVDLPGTHSNERMTLISALTFSLTGIALLMLDIKQTVWLIQTCAFISGMFGLFILTGLAFHANVNSKFFPYAYTSIHSAISFILIALAIFFMRPHQGLMRIMISHSEGGKFARDLLPLFALVPVTIGYLRIWGQYHNLYDLESGVALFSSALTAILLLIILFSARKYMISDIKRKKTEIYLKRSEERWKLAMEIANQGVWDWYVPEKIMHFSPAWKTMLGYKDDEVKDDQHEFESLIHPDDLEKFWKEIQKHFEGKNSEYVCEARFRCKDGSYKWILDRGKVITRAPDGSVLRAMGTHTDISELKQREDDLIAAQINIERSNQELQQFANIASHDLQEPLRTITSFVQLLEKKFRNKLDKESIEYIKFISDGTKRMHTLIEDLLNYSRITAKAKPFIATDCTRALQQALDSLQTTISEHQANITHDPLPVVFSDETQLRTVFQNLISNAIKYCEIKPVIHIGAKDRGKNWIISVEDNGIGIPEDQIDKLFVFYKRLRPASKYPGSGLGLAICKKIIERHNGRIWVVSKPGAGSTFCFTLPKKAPRNMHINESQTVLST